MNGDRVGIGPLVLQIVGTVLGLAGVVKATVIGYYDNEVPTMLAVFALGLACVGVGSLWAKAIRRRG
jgi:hypothetical protein